MVDHVTTGSNVGEDTTGVGLEVVSVGLDGDGDGLHGDSILEGSHGLGGDLGEGGNGDVGGLGLVVRAGTVGGGVSVVSLEVSIVAFEVGESASLPASVATHAGLNAVDELLLSEGKELTGSDLVSTFEGTS